MASKKIIASIFAVLGALLLGGSTTGSVSLPTPCYFLNQDFFECSSQIIIISTIIGIFFIFIAIFLLLKDFKN